jgi:hypothetical protein
MASLRDRLVKLEKKRQFLNWFVWHRLFDSLTADELRTYLREGKLPEVIPNRPSSLDRLDRKSLLKLWEEHERTFGGRTQEEMECYTKNGFWPEQRGRLYYSREDGKDSH